MSVLRNQAVRRALLVVLRMKRGRVRLLWLAIEMSMYEANTQGRLHPEKEGQSPGECEKMLDAAWSEFIRAVRRKV